MENKSNYEAPAAQVVELHLENNFCASVRMDYSFEEEDL